MAADRTNGILARRSRPQGGRTEIRGGRGDGPDAGAGWQPRYRQTRPWQTDDWEPKALANVLASERTHALRDAAVNQPRRLSPPAQPLALMLTVAGCLLASPSGAQQAAEDTAAEGTEGAGAESEGDAGLLYDPSISIDPTHPDVGSLPGGMQPAFGEKALTPGDWRFDFHGYLQVPLVVGVNTREDRQRGESGRVLHSPPVIPGDKETFSYTNTTPTPYVQLNFSYGNSVITGTVSVLAEQPTISTGFFDPPAQAGINDVFLTIHPNIGQRARLELYVGAFSNRYGTAGEYDQGRLGTPIIAKINGAGEGVLASLGLSKDLTLLLEQGIQGQSSKAPSDITPDGWNDWADPNAGTTFAHHVHAGIAYRSLATLGAHYVYGLSRDEKAYGANLSPDGKISVTGADLRLNLARFGHLYLAAAQTTAEHAGTVSRVIEILNTAGGQGLIDNYLGEASDGNGKLFTFGGQYDLSVGKLVSYPVPFSGDGPDITVSLFGLGTKVSSDDRAYDDITKLKYGIEGTYSLLSWFAVSGRYDKVDPNLDDSHYSFAVLSPRLIFRTDWQATNQITLQYSRYVYGSLTTVRTGYPPRDDVTVVPDADVLSLSAAMWW